jgi:3-oxoacyl-[acyl-carrier-protein] synthase II
MGLVSPLGNTREETWKNVLAGKSGAAPITQFHAETWPTRIACEVKDFILADEAMPQEHRKYLNRPSEFGAQATYEAIMDSEILGTVKPERLGVSVGASIGAISPHGLSRLLSGMDIESHSDKLHNLSSQVEQADETHIVMKNHPGTLAAMLSAKWQTLGPSTTIHTACASSGQSLGQAYLQIQRGDADAVVAGGADSLAGELLLAGFCLLGALSTRNDDPTSASRPFDKERDGFVASEGAAMMVLEEYERAKARGAKIYGEIKGYGETESAYRVTDLPANGRGIVEAMHIAIKEAGLDYSQVDYINAHGTSTEVNDRIEALAVRRVFGARGFSPMVSSTKSETGHLISAAGAMEAAFCALAIRDGKVPPTRNLYNTNCGDDIDFVAHEYREAPVYATLSNSIGFGGSNSSLAIVRCDV